MDDLISRQAAIDALDRIGSLDTEADKKYARSVFEALPAVQPQPIVRCKDCKHVQHDEVFDRYWCNGRDVTADWYCADGERV